MKKFVNLGRNESGLGTKFLGNYFESEYHYFGDPSHTAHFASYDNFTRCTFSRPSYDCFYMTVLRTIATKGPVSRKSLLDKNLTNYSMITAMGKAGLIVYSKETKKWYITTTGLNYYKNVIELLNA